MIAPPPPPSESNDFASVSTFTSDSNDFASFSTFPGDSGIDSLSLCESIESSLLATQTTNTPTLTPNSSNATKRRGRPPGSKNKPKPSANPN